MKKIFALTLALGLLCSTAACGDKPENSSAPVTEVVKLSLNSADITLAQDFSNITCISRDPLSNKILTFGELKNGGYAGYISDNSFSDYEQFRFSPQEDELVKYAAFMRSGRKAVMTLCDGETLIYVYDGNNELQKTLNCGEIIDVEGYYTLVPCEDGFIINDDNKKLTIVSSDGSISGTIDISSYLVTGVSLDSEGVPTVVYSDMEDTYTAHVEGTELTNKEKCSKLSSTAYSICAGFGDYKLAAILGGSLYVLRDGQWSELCDFMDNDFEAYSLYSIAMTGENEFAAVHFDYNDPKMFLLTEADISEMKAKQVITMASFSQSGSGGYFDEEVKKFNASSDDYRIEYRNYYDEEAYEWAVDDLKLDMISGNAPDIIPLNPELPVDTLNYGIFCDLYEFMEDDPDLSPDDFLPNIREGLERDGKMIMLTPTFYFSTVAAKAGYPGVRENWSFDDMIEAYNATPEGMYFFDGAEESQHRSVYFGWAVNPSFFIDYDKAECHFDSPEFIKMLNFINDNEIGLTWDEYTSLSGDFYYEDPQFDIDDGKAFVDFREGHRGQWFGQIFTNVRGHFEDQCVFVGRPFDGVENGSYINFDFCLAIMANSPHKEGAWSFLRYLVSDEYYDDFMHYYSYPVLEDKFDERAQMTVDGYLSFPYDENYRVIEGDLIREDWHFARYNMDGELIFDKVLEPFTQEECEYYKDMVKNAKVMRYDSTVSYIINEETNGFFNEEGTAEKVAEAIQNRVSLYLSERYS